MASSRRTGTSEAVTTYGNGTRDYSSLATWEAATDIDCVAGTTSPVLECYKDGTPYDDNILMNGAITNSSYFRILRAASGEEHGGIFDAGVHFDNTATATICLGINGEPFSSIQDLQCSQTINSSTNRTALYVEGTVGGQADTVGLLVSDGTNAYAAKGTQGVILVYGTAVDCIVKGQDAGGGTTIYDGVGILLNSGTGLVYNCTSVANDGDGIALVAGTLTVKNANAHGNGITHGTDIEDNAGITITTCNPATKGETGATPSYDAGTYRQSSSDTVLKDNGTDLSGDGTFPFDDDIAFNSRSAPWDIGAFEYVSSTTIPPYFMHHINHNCN